MVAAQPFHCAPLARRMRDIDQQECRAFGREPKDALRRSLSGSLYAMTAMVDDRPIAMLGVVATGLMTRRGVPWLLGSDEVFDQARTLLVTGPRIIAWWHESFDLMENLVGSENERAIRLLERWGATVDDAEAVHGGMAFRSFRFSRDSSR